MPVVTYLFIEENMEEQNQESLESNSKYGG